MIHNTKGRLDSWVDNCIGFRYTSGMRRNSMLMPTLSTRGKREKENWALAVWYETVVGAGPPSLEPTAPPPLGAPGGVHGHPGLDHQEGEYQGGPGGG